jgi:hypothetical protein
VQGNENSRKQQEQPIAPAQDQPLFHLMNFVGIGNPPNEERRPSGAVPFNRYVVSAYRCTTKRWVYTLSPAVMFTM